VYNDPDQEWIAHRALTGVRQNAPVVRATRDRPADYPTQMLQRIAPETPDWTAAAKL
jgi:hypothetical protein